MPTDKSPENANKTPIPTEEQQTLKKVGQVFDGKVLGNPGTQHYGGYFLEEYNKDWRDERRVETVEQMRRGDATIKAVLNAIKAPMLATKWRVDIASDDPTDQEIRTFVENSLFGMKRTWKEFLPKCL